MQNDTLGHRGRKDDPLYRCRRLLTKADERLTDKGRSKLLGLLEAGDPQLRPHPTSPRRLDISVDPELRYTRTVTKRLVDIDDGLLAEVRDLTGAATMKEAVNAALQEVIDAELRRRHLRRLESGAGTDLADDGVMRGAWR